MTAQLTAAETRALAALDRESLVADLRTLVGIPSVGGSPAECDIQHHLARRLTELGLDVDLWPLDLPALTADPAFPGWEVPRAEAWGLAGASGPGRPALVLQGHVDVVPPGDLTRWASPPFRPEIRGSGTAARLHGRGACDMKAGLAANLAAAGAVRAAGIRLARPFALHCVVGEEDGGLGAFATLARGHAGDACVISEPTGGTVVTANAGSLTFAVEVAGSATHGSTAWAGVSAVDAYLPVHAALAALQARRNAAVDPRLADLPVAYPISVGMVRGGDWASSVPDLLRVEGRLGVALGEDLAAARADLEGAVAAAAARDPWLRDHPPVVSWPGGRFASGEYDAGSPLLGTLSRAHAEVTGTGPPAERGAPYGSDLRLYAAAGLPTLHYGPGEVRLAHGPEESVAVAELVTVAETLTLTLVRACG